MQNKDPIPGRQLVVSVPEQKLRVWRDGQLLAEYPVSTSKFGIGSEPGSYRTPVGSFRIGEKIGAGSPAGTVFRARRPTGETAPQGGNRDLILTRIIRIEGLDPENRNTYDRLIYLHGTNQESLLGTPASHGCIRLANQDIKNLFDLVEPGDGLRIET